MQPAPVWSGLRTAWIGYLAWVCLKHGVFIDLHEALPEETLFMRLSGGLLAIF
jgi:hypothetical protein